MLHVLAKTLDGVAHPQVDLAQIDFIRREPTNVRNEPTARAPVLGHVVVEPIGIGHFAWRARQPAAVFAASLFLIALRQLGLELGRFFVAHRRAVAIRHHHRRRRASFGLTLGAGLAQARRRYVHPLGLGPRLGRWAAEQPARGHIHGLAPGGHQAAITGSAAVHAVGISASMRVRNSCLVALFFASSFS